ncbi:Cytochrome b5-like heme/steroid binding domain [Phytophthora cactorum]|nr:Cytochrome b5-like heme/steroid binding domain [Phytophthora cactorum]
MSASPVNDSTLPSGSSNSGGDTVIAQYLATKVSWWATYPRILVVTASTLSTYNPETFQCTNQWEIADIEDVELSPTKNHFVLRLEKARFRSAKLKFVCAAQGHLLSLLARLRRQAQGKALLYRLVKARRLHFRCIENYADGSHKLLFLQVTVSSIIFLDECGRRGMVLSTVFHDRFFLCPERHECLNEIVAAAKDAGVEMYKTSTHITALQLRLHNTQVLDRASVIRFDVKKARNTENNGDAAPESDASDGGKKAYNDIQLILQGDAIVEMHRSKRTVIARPYSALLAIVRPDWDPRTLVLEFKQEDTLVLDLDGRDQLVTLLLLVCREAGQHNVVLISSGLNYCRFYHPHAADTASTDSSIAGMSMATFLLRRITQTSVHPEDNNGGRSRGGSIWSPADDVVRVYRLRELLKERTTPQDPTQRRINKDKRMSEPVYEMRNSIDSDLSLNEGELNANLPLDELTRSGPGQVEVVNKAMELVFEHLVTLVATLRRYGDTTSSELITTLQALVRLYHHPDACFTDDMHAIVDLIPASFAASNDSSFMANSSSVGTAFWTVDPEIERGPPSSLSSNQSSVLFTKEARVQNEINVVFYETLLTLHHLLVCLRSAAKEQRVARNRQNYIAATNRQMHQKHDVPAEKQTDALAGKLLDKHRFLKDSIVDVRLVRMAETSVALVKFVLSHFATKTTANQLQQTPSDNQLSHDNGGDFYETRKKRLGALGSFLDDYQAVAEGRMETPSLMFGTERTIEMPVEPFSNATSESTNAAMARLLNPGTTNRLGTVMSKGSMRLEHLNPSEPPSSIRDDDFMVQLESESSTKSLEKDPYKLPTEKEPYKKPPNLLKDDDEDDTVGPLLNSDHISTPARSPRATRKPFQASVGARRTANECDACIGCNDVCTNERCFFCAEKEYQLKVAFAGSSVATGSTVRQTAWQHRAPSSVDSSSSIEREYSSCEMKRHQSQHSCWIRVDGSVFDVTELLSVHPGGAQVLLEAAQHGGDCNPILKTHPPAAREMMMQYRLGRYYECSKC